MTLKFYTSIAFFFLITIFNLKGFSQKLPSVQENSVSAPVGLRIDGKNKEWNAGFQASNKRTSLQYTICNDDKNLYLVIKSLDVTNNRKILAGGITFAVNPDGEKKEKESIALTYPVWSRNMGRGGRRQGPEKGNRVSAKERDSIAVAGQRTQLAQAKEIKIKGFKNTVDSVVSIYNEFGIKAFASIGEDNAFFYEAAIPFEALGITKDYAKKMAYHIKVNGLQIQGFNGVGMIRMSAGRGGDSEDLTSSTDFWGKYTLAKK